MYRYALKPAFLALLAAFVLATPSRAGQGQSRGTTGRTSHYDKAQLQQALISSEGALRLSRQLKPLAGLDATHVWDVVEDRDGNLIVATGDEGKIYKVTPDGKVGRALHQRRQSGAVSRPRCRRLRLRRHRTGRHDRADRRQGDGQGLLRDRRVLRLVAGGRAEDGRL